MSVRRNKRRAWGIYAPGALAALLLSYSAIHGVPGVVVQSSIHMVANVVGATASVPVTPENTIAAQLAMRELSLDDREVALSDRERSQAFRENALPLASFLASIVLAILVSINFFLDFRRQRSFSAREVVNLRRS